MAVKQRKRKRNRIKAMYENAVKIECRFCDLSGKCKFQLGKEQSQAMGMMTYCTLTPNKPKKKKRKPRYVANDNTKKVSE